MAINIGGWSIYDVKVYKVAIAKMLEVFEAGKRHSKSVFARGWSVSVHEFRFFSGSAVLW